MAARCTVLSHLPFAMWSALHFVHRFYQMPFGHTSNHPWHCDGKSRTEAYLLTVNSAGRIAAGTSPSPPRSASPLLLVARIRQAAICKLLSTAPAIAQARQPSTLSRLRGSCARAGVISKHLPKEMSTYLPAFGVESAYLEMLGRVAR